jgi:prophage maintenance system killer protein
MKISKEELLRINKGFGGELRNGSSIDYAMDVQNNKKLGVYKKLAYLIRAILVDHPFSDGNKRTAAYIALKFANECNKEVDRELLLHHIIAIAKDNITEIRQIEWRMKNAIK